MSNYWKKKLDELNQSTKSSSASTGDYWQSKMTELETTVRKKEKEIDEDIAPVKQTTDKKERKWFDTGAFDDGYQFGDIIKTILGTGRDVGENLVTGVVGMGEKVLDAGMMLGAAMNQSKMMEAANNEIMYNALTGNGIPAEKTLSNYQKMQDDVEKGAVEFVKQDLYDEKEVAKTILLSDAVTDLTGIDPDKHSVLGEKSEALVQSAGQLAAQFGLQAVGVPWFVTAGATSFGSEAENALNQGATFAEANLSATISAGAEILTEKLFGGDVFTKGTGSVLATETLATAISNKTIRTLTKLGIDAAGEGFEEVASQAISNLGSSLYKEENLAEILFSEEALDEYIESFVGGTALGGGMGGINAVVSSKNGVDYATGLTKNEQAVVDKVYNYRLAEALAEADGDLSQSEKNKLYREVLEQMDKGYISTDTIEEVLGGEAYKSYKDTVDSEDALQAEFDTLNKMKQGEMTGEQIDRRNELKQQLKDLETTSQRNQLKTQLGENVLGMVKGDRLVESYNERTRRTQAFEADLTQYDAKQQATIKKAVESGILNNTNRTHEFVDMIAKISADKGVLFDFTNNQKLKDSGFAVDGKSVNGYVTKDGVTLNIDSSKSLNSVTGHEITHILEGTELYTELQNTLFNYAKSKGEYDSRLANLTELYKGVKDADINAELTADLVGDYLFTDTDFINKLSVENRNIFQKIYDEIKYLCKVATAGSKEARELERVKKAFEDAYRADSKARGDTKYSISDKNIKDISTGYASGETYYTMSYTQDGKVVATLEYGEYDGNPNVKMVEVEPEYRRKGIATKLLQELQKKYPDTEIDFGMTTPDGTKLLDSITYDVTDEAVVADRQQLKDLQTELNELQEKLDILYDTENLTEAQEAELHKLGDRWEEVYRSINKLEPTLRGKRAKKTFVKYSIAESPVKQEISSAGTSLNQIPALFKDKNVQFGETNIDIGGGKFDQAKNFLAEQGTNSMIFDPYNRGAEENQATLKFLQDGNRADTATCANVLNVIAEPAARSNVILEAAKSIKPDGTAYFMVYEGNGSGVGKQTSAGWQNNRKTADYVGEISEWFETVQRKGKLIIAKDPVANLPKASWEVQPGEAVRYSLSDSDGKQLTTEQQEYFKNSKMRDENGNLKVMYHGSQDAGFHEFSGRFSDDDISFFFVDRNDVAASYSGTTETYEARTIRTAEDMNKFIAEIDAEGYEVVEKDGKFILLYEGDRVADSETAKGIYEEFCWYEGVGEGDANYKVYLNLTNPLVVDAEGRNWNNVTREYSQEIADRYHSLTAEEKAALADLAGWEDFGAFEDEIGNATDLKAPTTEETAVLASAYYKLAGKENKVNMYDLFSIASDNFSEEAIKEFAVKQTNTRDIAQKAKAEGYDGVIFNNIVDLGGYSNGSEGASTVAIAFNSNQIKSVANEKPTADPDIRYSLSEDSQGRELSEEQRNFFRNAKTTDEQGRLKPFYHGTARADRVGNVFDPNRATSGPMAFFTDNRQVADNYARDKADTSLEYDEMYDDYYTQFRTEINGKNMSVSEAWNYLSPSKKFEIKEKAKHIKMDEDYENVIYDKNEQYGVGGFDSYTINMHKGNILEALTDSWLESGTIYGEEQLFLDVLKLAGLDNVQYMNPDFRAEKTYEAYLNITNPFVTTDISEEMLEAFKAAAEKVEYVEGRSADTWDKRNISPEQWIERLEDDIKKGTTHSWTSIPDFVTDILKEYGYDGIFDTGGKGGGVVHTVAIPFYSEQIKNVDNKAPSTDPDIRKSLSAQGETPKSYGRNNVYGKDIALEQIAPAKTAQETAKAEQNVSKTENVAPVAKKAPSAVLYNMRDGENGWGDVYGTAQEALNDAVKSFDSDLWDAFNAEIDNTPENTPLPRGSTPIVNALIAVQEDVRQETITPMQGAQLLSEAYNQGGVNALNRIYNHSTGNLYQQYLDKAKQYETVAPVAEMFPDDLAPVEAELDNLLQQKEVLEDKLQEAIAAEDFEAFNQVGAEYDTLMERLEKLEEEAATQDAGRLDSITDNDAPPEMEAPYPGEPSESVTVESPLADRDYSAVGKDRKAKAFMVENPEFKPFFKEEAEKMLWDLNDSQKAERWYNDRLYYESGGEKGFGGQPRLTSEDIAELLDDWGMSWAQIEEGLIAIANENERVNNAPAKHIEFMLHQRLAKGYTDFHTKKRVAPNQAYLDMLKQRQAYTAANEYSKDAFDNLVAYGDELAPAMVGEENATTTETTEDIAPVAEQYEAIRPKPQKEPRMARATPAEQARAEILTEEPKVEKQKSGFRSKINNLILDKGLIFEDLSLATGNRELQAKWNSIRYAEGKAQKLIGEGNAFVDSLKSIQERVEKSGKTKQFYEYLYHMHNVDRMTLEERFKDVPNKAVFGDSVTADISRDAADKLVKANPEFTQWAEDVYSFNKYLRELLVDGGVISSETAKLWETMYPHYVPIRRAGDTGLNINVPLDTGRTGVNAPIKRAKGGSRDILPLFDTMGQRTIQTFKAIAKNRFGVELKNTLGTTIENEMVDIDEAIDSIDTQDGLLQEGKNGQKPTFTVFENGKKVTFEITDEMYDAMKPTNELFSGTSKVLNTVSNIRRGTLTEYNPWFLLKNAVKDVQDVLINSQHAAKTYAAIPSAIKQMATNGHWYQEYMDNGGDQNTYFDNQTNTFTEENKALEIAKKVTGLDAISKANNIIERLPRLAEYIASRKMKRSIDVAMLDAARVTTNFAAGGDATKWLNRNGATFLNASVQGAMQQARNIREAKVNGLKGWASLAAKYTLAGLPAVLLNHLLWGDDEEYDELSDYVKENYYIVGQYGDGKFVRIPKGRTVAVIQNAFEQMENLITGNDEVDLGRFLDLVVSNLAPNNPLDNNILSPIVQVANNKTWYGEDLVPTRLQDLPAAEQYDESTDAISRWLGENLNYSPVKINYLLDQYSGVIGDTFLPMLTPEAESGNNTFGGNMIAPLKDMFTTDSVMNNQNVSAFYDTMDKQTTNAKSSKATDEDVLKSKYLNAVSADMSDLYKQKREVQNSNLPDDEKYEQVRNIQQQIDTLAKEALANYENINREGDYADIGGVYFQWYKPEKGEPYWRKLSDEQATKYKLTSKAGNAHYVTDGNVHYRLDEEGEWTKISDRQLERQNEVTKALGITPDEYWSKTDISFLPMSDGEYEYAFENPDNYAVAKAVGGYDAYKTYSSELYNIKADKDENGKSISGSRKEKVIDYVNGLDIDYGERLILIKSEYPADDTYNNEIIDYLNSREDISYEEMETILKELGFTVSSDGTISWD